jgi:hypothetical protein
MQGGLQSVQHSPKSGLESLRSGVKGQNPHLRGAHPGNAAERDGGVLHQAARHHARGRSQNRHQPLGDRRRKGAQLLGPLLDRQFACGILARWVSASASLLIVD